MDLLVAFDSGRWQARCGAEAWPCAVGRGGVRGNKCEGDGATPAGAWPLRRVLYRADRLQVPRTALDCTPIARDQGWCDDPADEHYNAPVRLPYPARHERLWREEEIYDCVVVLGYNDRPAVPGAGSAIFLHLARPDFAPTAGCVALRRRDLLSYLARATPDSRVCVLESGAAGPI